MTHEEARQFVKKHLYYNAHRPFSPTPRQIKYWWRVLNIAVFYGKLQYPEEIVLIRLKNNTWAKIWSNDVNIKKGQGRKITKLAMQPKYPSKGLFLAVLVHEMVHSWEHQHHTVMGHGKRFMMWKNRIKRTTGMLLEVAIGEEDYTYEF